MINHYYFHMCNGNKCGDSKIEFNPNVDFVEDSKGRVWRFIFTEAKPGGCGRMLLRRDKMRDDSSKQEKGSL